MSNDAQKVTPGRFVWYDLMTHDAEGAQAFYKKVVGWGTESWGDAPEGLPPYTMFTNSLGPLGGINVMPPEVVAGGAVPHWIAYVTHPDVEAAIAQAEELGAKVMMPAMDMPSVGCFAVLSDPQGALFAPYCPAGPSEAPTAPPQVGQFSWHELMTADHKTAFTFYSEIFGWQAGEAMDMGPAGIYQLYGLDPAMPYGGMMDKPAEVPMSAWIYYIRVDDLDAAVARAQEAGGTLCNGPMDVPGGDRIAQLTDPQGAFFALHEVGGGS